MKRDRELPLLTLALFGGLTGYSLSDDLWSGAGLRVTEGVVISLSLVGTYIRFFLSGVTGRTRPRRGCLGG
ncbi:cytochrome b N-terminal domain-containing protein [Nonomuraea jabiensis]|uniref:Cytochrome bc1 complex cytochrome b subunit n=1 Tax=Nonomuraea jabiensis TaxID=882448 RepID=A0A7W9LF98_9ACTN|nr:quinol-cytochrome oxidoreductase complex cytochrome b subunit [Nonomuraea jabiensis]